MTHADSILMAKTIFGEWSPEYRDLLAVREDPMTEPENTNDEIEDERMDVLVEVQSEILRAMTDAGNAKLTALARQHNLNASEVESLLDVLFSDVEFRLEVQP